MKEGILCDNQVRFMLCSGGHAPVLVPVPPEGAGDFLIAADKGYEALEATARPPIWWWAILTPWAAGPTTPM